jgi:hypothetical protein
MGISTKGNANTKAGTKRGAADAAKKKSYGSATAYADVSKTGIPIKGKK